MHPIVFVLAGFVPGLAHGLLSRRRAMVVAIAAVAAAFVVTAFTVWGIWLVFAVLLASGVHAALGFRKRRPGRVQWNWVNAAISIATSLVLSIAVPGFIVEGFRIPASSGYPTLQIGDHVYADKLSLLWRAPAPGDVIVFRQPCEQRDYVKRVVAIGGDKVEIRCSVVYVNGSPIAQTLVAAADHYDDVDDGGGRPTVSVSRYHESVGGHGFDVFYTPDRPSRDDKRHHEYVGDDRGDFPTEVLRNCENPEGGAMPRHNPSQQPGELVSAGDQREQCKPFRQYVVPEGHVFVLGDNRDNSNDSRYWGSVPLDHVKGVVHGIWFPLDRFGGID